MQRLQYHNYMEHFNTLNGNIINKYIINNVLKLGVKMLAFLKSIELQDNKPSTLEVSLIYHILKELKILQIQSKVVYSTVHASKLQYLVILNNTIITREFMRKLFDETLIDVGNNRGYKTLREAYLIVTDERIQGFPNRSHLYKLLNMVGLGGVLDTGARKLNLKYKYTNLTSVIKKDITHYFPPLHNSQTQVHISTQQTHNIDNYLKISGWILIIYT
eukprot:GHVR01045598.1.p1 GENE.GHVR01045598.1~~GHVR01045598.1.p1  ORF type:complete len:218 (-),score=9.54 GHVR01045598.1:460-1113(-)